MKKFVIGFVTLCILGSIVFGLTRGMSVPQKNSNKPTIVTSIYPLYFFATQIVGDKMNVVLLTPSGVEPHEYELTVQDRATIEKSTLLVVNGQLENWADKVKQSLQNTNVTYVVAGGGLFSENDPHIWLDPKLAKEQALAITQAVLSHDSTNAAYYEKNTNLLLEKLTKLDKKYRMGLEQCQKRDIVTSHNAFSYLAKAYNLKQVSIAGISTESEPSSKQLAVITEYVRQNDVSYIFFERLVSPKLAQTLAQEVGAKTLVLDPLEGLSEDEMRQGENYFSVMEENLHNLQIALQCTQ